MENDIEYINKLESFVKGDRMVSDFIIMYKTYNEKDPLPTTIVDFLNKKKDYLDDLDYNNEEDDEEDDEQYDEDPN